MTAAGAVMVLGSLLAVALFWALPRERGQDAVAGLTLLTVASLSPLSAFWLGGAALVTPLVMRASERAGRRGAGVAIWGAMLVAALFASRTWTAPFWIGAAYFTLRHLHVLIEWWMGRIAVPTIAAHLRYQLFLPVLMAGPIHRIQHFERQCERRRWEAAAFFSGAERALLGAAQAVVVGYWVLARVETGAASAMAAWPAFWRGWALSALDWVQLYVTFSGLTSLALGLSLMMGLRLEENFDRPWAARTLIEFWSRWHMTLSFWCRDYVFQPVAALARQPVIALFAGMLVMGLWHASSAYYVLWAVWQTAGIVITRLAMRLPLPRLPARVAAVLGPLSVLAWLSLAAPVISMLGIAAP